MHEYSEFSLKTIMFATDLSPASFGAQGYARQLARQFSAKILLVHVIDETLLTRAEKENLGNTIDSAEKELQTQVSQLANDRIESRMIVRRGDIRESILDLIAERNVDLLVVGTKGKSFKEGEDIGSIAEKLLRVMPCPVLAVGTRSRMEVFDGLHRHNILVPTDFSEASHVAISYAESLAHRLSGHLFLLHVENGAAASPLMKVTDAAEKFKVLTERIAEPSLIAECITSIGSPVERIVATANEKDVDLIVMRVHAGDQPAGTRLNGVAYDVIQLAKCPVFTLFAPSAH